MTLGWLLAIGAVLRFGSLPGCSSALSSSQSSAAAGSLVDGQEGQVRQGSK